MSDTKLFKPLPMFAAKLSHELHAHECFLPVSTEKAVKLCDYLGADCYTYLTLGDGCDFETVKVELSKGFLYLERGANCTDKRTWPCGTCIEFHMDEQGYHDMINQALPDQPEEELEPCGFNGTMCVGRWDYTFKNGWLEKRECNNNRLPNSYVDNPVLCFDEDGCLIEAGEGSPRLAMSRCK